MLVSFSVGWSRASLEQARDEYIGEAVVMAVIAGSYKNYEEILSRHCTGDEYVREVNLDR